MILRIRLKKTKLENNSKNYNRVSTDKFPYFERINNRQVSKSKQYNYVLKVIQVRFQDQTIKNLEFAPIVFELSKNYNLTPKVTN